MDTPKAPSDLQHHESSYHPSSPQYKPYPKSSSSFLEGTTPSTLCACCGFRGNRAASCLAKQSTPQEWPIIISWKENHLESNDGSHICLHYNVRNACMMQPSDHHRAHSCSFCGNACHGVNICTRNQAIKYLV